jgi:hypothetical protein
MKAIRLLMATSLALSFSAARAQNEPINLKTQAEVMLRKASPDEHVRLNMEDHSLIIGRYKIPYMNVTYGYKHITTDYNGTGVHNFVKISCPASESSPSGYTNCILMDRSEEDSTVNFDMSHSVYCSDYSAPFITKDDAYDFMDLMDKVKKQK